MNNLKKLINDLGGLYLPDVDPESVTDKTLRMINCPYIGADDGLCDEIEGSPSETQCAACKRKWLAREAEVL